MPENNWTSTCYVLIKNLYSTYSASINITLVLSLIGLLIKYIYSRKTYKVTLEAHKLNVNKQEIEEIQKRLDKLYYPLRKILNKYGNISVENIMSKEYQDQLKEDLCDIEPHIQFSSEKLYPPLNRFISIFDKNATLITNQYREKLEIQKNNSSEEDIEYYKMLELMLHDHWSNARSKIWAIPNQTEAEEAMSLYSQILGIIDEDISNYRLRTKE